MKASISDYDNTLKLEAESEDEIKDLEQFMLLGHKHGFYSVGTGASPNHFTAFIAPDLEE